MERLLRARLVEKGTRLVKKGEFSLAGTRPLKRAFITSRPQPIVEPPWPSTRSVETINSGSRRRRRRRCCC
jgi:hypothetical protein